MDPVENEEAGQQVILGQAADDEVPRRFAGDELAKAKYYDFDPDFLLELEPEVTHLDVIEP